MSKSFRIFDGHKDSVPAFREVWGIEVLFLEYETVGAMIHGPAIHFTQESEARHSDFITYFPTHTNTCLLPLNRLWITCQSDIEGQEWQKYKT